MRSAEDFVERTKQFLFVDPPQPASLPDVHGVGDGLAQEVVANQRETHPLENGNRLRCCTDEPPHVVLGEGLDGRAAHDRTLDRETVSPGEDSKDMGAPDGEAYHLKEPAQARNRKRDGGEVR